MVSLLVSESALIFGDIAAVGPPVIGSTRTASSFVFGRDVIALIQQPLGIIIGRKQLLLSPPFLFVRGPLAKRRERILSLSFC
jgi:hypothetical protein